MTDTKVPAALSPAALFGKSQFYMHKALRRKDENDLDEYQLWASLALELLGKSTLARKHPSLIADPQHYQSLFAAAGIGFSSDIKTIAAHTLYERLGHCVREFDEKTKGFCMAIAQRRNAELHSGETPFRTMRAESWEAQFWHAAQIILGERDATLEDWLGASESEAPKAMLKHVREATIQAVRIRIERAKENFEKRGKRDRELALSDSASRESYHYRNLFTLLSDKDWSTQCPSCGGKAFLAGMQVDEDVIDTRVDEDGPWESVEKFYVAEQFHCPVCNLFLDGSAELAATNLEIEYSETDEREMQYAPEYGND